MTHAKIKTLMNDMNTIQIERVMNEAMYAYEAAVIAEWEECVIECIRVELLGTDVKASGYISAGIRDNIAMLVEKEVKISAGHEISNNMSQLRNPGVPGIVAKARTDVAVKLLNTPLRFNMMFDYNRLFEKAVASIGEEKK